MKPSKIRISLDLKRQNSASLLVEQLRYAGLVFGVSHQYRNDEDSDGVLSFTIESPGGFKPSAWADMNVRRMKSFGIKAEEV